MSTTVFGALALFQEAEPSTLQNILRSLPTDPASIFTLLLVVGVTGLVIWTGRKGGGKGAAP